MGEREKEHLFMQWRENKADKPLYKGCLSQVTTMRLSSCLLIPNAYTNVQNLLINL